MARLPHLALFVLVFLRAASLSTSGVTGTDNRDANTNAESANVDAASWKDAWLQGRHLATRPEPTEAQTFGAVAQLQAALEAFLAAANTAGGHLGGAGSASIGSASHAGILADLGLALINSGFSGHDQPGQCRNYHHDDGHNGGGGGSPPHAPGLAHHAPRCVETDHPCVNGAKHIVDAVTMAPESAQVLHCAAWAVQQASSVHGDLACAATISRALALEHPRPSLANVVHYAALVKELNASGWVEGCVGNNGIRGVAGASGGQGGGTWREGDPTGAAAATRFSLSSALQALQTYDEAKDPTAANSGKLARDHRKRMTERVFAVASLFDQLGEYDVAIEKYTEGNEAVRRTIPSGRVGRYLKLYKATREDYPTERLREMYGVAGAGAGPRAAGSSARQRKAVDEAEGEPEADRWIDPLTAYTPILVVGFPRSGTSLIEHRLRAHAGDAAVLSFGEISIFRTLIQALRQAATDANKPFPEYVAHTAAGLEPYQRRLRTIMRRDPKLNQLRAKLARQVAGAGASAGAGLSHFTVKNCFDVVQYGFALPLLFPNARVVIVTRDPRDSGFSNYAHNFGNLDDLSYAFDLDDIARYYTEYMATLAHWKDSYSWGDSTSVATATNITQAGPNAGWRRPRAITIGYENLTLAPEAQMRRLLEFVGLPTDGLVGEGGMAGGVGGGKAQSLTPASSTASQGVVSSYSAMQTHRPLNRDHCGHWRRYERYLGPLLALGHGPV